MRRSALRVALSDKVRNGYITVIEDLSVEKPNTKAILDMLSALGVKGSTLIVTTAPTDDLRRSTRNIPNTDTMASRLLSPLETTRARNIIISKHAVESIDELWGHPTSKPGRVSRKVEEAGSPA
jgi:large subunit ribosomal protein L4